VALVVAELVSSPDHATGTAACVTIVRAAFDVASVRLRVNMPTAATSPVVVCANLRIENEPVTCGVEATSRSGVVAVVTAVVDAVVDVVVDADVVDVCVGVVVGVSEDVVGEVVDDAGGSVEVVGGCAGVAGATGVVGTPGVTSVPVTGMISLPGVA
jgi:hypothetical protein